LGQNFRFSSNNESTPKSLKKKVQIYRIFFKISKPIVKKYISGGDSVLIASTGLVEYALIACQPIDKTVKATVIIH